jgi:hypothetical protein
MQKKDQHMSGARVHPNLNSVGVNWEATASVKLSDSDDEDFYRTPNQEKKQTVSKKPGEALPSHVTNQSRFSAKTPKIILTKSSKVNSSMVYNGSQRQFIHLPD